MSPIEEKLEISEFNYKVLKGKYKHVVNERDELKKDYKQLEERHKNALNMYYEYVIKQNNTEKELKHVKDNYDKMYKSYSTLIMEREGLRKKYKEVNRDFFIVSILLFISLALVIFG